MLRRWKSTPVTPEQEHTCTSNNRLYSTFPMACSRFIVPWYDFIEGLVIHTHTYGVIYWLNEELASKSSSDDWCILGSILKHLWLSQTLSTMWDMKEKRRLLSEGNLQSRSASTRVTWHFPGKSPLNHWNVVLLCLTYITDLYQCSYLDCNNKTGVWTVHVHTKSIRKC